ncbi:MAG TPA: HD domain-containing protein [Bryobacteraceae bacterium]|nr:HD domain-containing protein [Bryobacteraceae bacterium]
MSPVEQIAQRSDQVDAQVASVFEQTQPRVTLAAVGGYGRRELFPHSDVDLLLLIDSQLSAEEREPVAEFLRLLWDSGLRVSQSVRTAAECCEIHDGNLELTISLLDHRYLAGDRKRYDQLAERFPKFLNAQRADIARHLCQMTRARHAKYGTTIYHLEPNVKEHPGGLRDLHVLHWLSLLRNSMEAPPPAAPEFLFETRIFLHNHSSRDNNLLSFDAQEAISDAPAAFMRRYYRSARDIFRTVVPALDTNEATGNSLLTTFRDWRGRVSTTEFTVARERVLLREPGLLRTDPTAISRLVQFAARHQLQLAADTERRVREALENGAPVAADWENLRPLLILPHSTLGLRALQETGALERILPDWKNIDCLVIRDFSHRYTVDEHTLQAISILESLRETTDPLRRRFADLLSEIEQPDVLRMALLLHDIGKGGGTGEHASVSVQLAGPALERMHAPEAVRSAVLFLIEHHIDLSSVMSSRDLSDPATGRDVGERVGTIERLKLLTLLTYADISAVHPNAMTPWRLEQLWATYLIAYSELTKELDSERIDPLGMRPDLAWFLEGFPKRYLRTHSEAEILRHHTLARQRLPAMDLFRAGGAYRITVISEDRPALLVSVSGALAGFGMNILKAEAFVNARQQLLATLTFSDPHRTLELNPPEAGRLRDTVLRTLEGKLDVAALLKKRRQPALPGNGRIQVSVAFNQKASDRATLIEIVAEDRPGLLYDLCNTLAGSGCNIEVVLIDTEAHKALDVFYVTAGGKKLEPALEVELKEKLIGACR